MASNLVKLISSDNKTIEVDVAVAKESRKVKNIIEAMEAMGIDKPIPLPHVSGDTLAKVVEYCKYHVESRKTTDDKPATPEAEIKAWDANFMNVDRQTVFALTAVADYLKIKNLQDLTSETLAGMTVEEFRDILFNVILNIYRTT